MKKVYKEQEPNFGNFIDVLKRNNNCKKVVFFELFADMEIEYEILKRKELLAPNDFEIHKEEYKNCWQTTSPRLLKRHIKYMYNLGYDYINVGPIGFEFPKIEWSSTITKEGSRTFAQSTDSVIKSYNDFKNYPWPDMNTINYAPFGIAEKIIPNGMKVISGFGGILEHVMFLLGYDGISYLLYDNPNLVENTFKEVGIRIVKYFDSLASIDIVGALAYGDDMGFKTGTMLSPQVYRKYLFPWHKKLVDTVHKHGKPIILHSCGNLSEIMDDIIACGWDAKHSFEDSIQPVWEAKKIYGDKISVLGGFDIDKLCRMNVEEVRAHAKFLIDGCLSNSGWMLGTGNSVASYIKVENFLAMLEEGNRINKDLFGLD